MQISGCSSAYCKLQLLHGPNWQLLGGTQDGITQITSRAPGCFRWVAFGGLIEQVCQCVDGTGMGWSVGHGACLRSDALTALERHGTNVLLLLSLLQQQRPAHQFPVKRRIPL